MYYKVSDNSYCINVVNRNHALLVQEHDEWYSPDKNEDGATFEIVSEPYVEQILTFSKYEDRTFINVKSSLTGNVYRVLYKEDQVYNKSSKFSIKLVIVIK